MLFTGYCSAVERELGIASLPSVEWIEGVDAFVTLGSPIDKYLDLWKPNYGYLQTSKWMARQRDRERLIRHFNYCDEQDPVGHHIDLPYVTENVAVHKVMGGFVADDAEEAGRHGPAEDVVFTRYATPGLAHVRYWTDGPLFAHILDRAVDDASFPHRERRAPTPDWFKVWRYVGALGWAYNVIPVLFFLAVSITLTTALPLFRFGPTPTTGATLETRVTALLAALVATYIGTRLVWLMVMWRQTLMEKERRRREQQPLLASLWQPVVWLWRAITRTGPAEQRQRGAAGIEAGGGKEEEVDEEDAHPIAALAPLTSEQAHEEG